MAKAKNDLANEIERLSAEGKAPIATKRQMQMQLEQGRGAVWTLRVGVAILMLSVPGAAHVGPRVSRQLTQVR